LLERKCIQLELFDENEIAEVIDPEDTTLRYCLCRKATSFCKRWRQMVSAFNEEDLDIEDTLPTNGYPRLSWA